MMYRKHPTRAFERRRGVAAVEFAVCLPMLIVLFIGMIEACTMIFLKQSLAVAAYEGMHTALQGSSTTADVEATCNAILTQRRVAAGQVEIVPANYEALEAGEFFTVRVTAPTNGNSFLPMRFFGNLQLQAEATMLKEL